jgi:hypothetical protein
MVQINNIQKINQLECLNIIARDILKGRPHTVGIRQGKETKILIVVDVLTLQDRT